MDRNATEEELRYFIEEWVDSLSLDSEEEVSSTIASTNSIFSEQYCEDVELNFEERGRYSFIANVSMPHTEPRGEHVFFNSRDQINVRVKGILSFNDDYNEWEIEDYNVTAGLQDYDDEVREPIPTAEDIINRLSNLQRGLWFRGHSDSNWSLVTSIGRIENPSLSMEKELRREFERRIAFLDTVKHPLPLPDIYFLMQHHGIPTRLMDWTTNPLVALYFALFDESQKTKNACIWVMDPRQLNRYFKEPYPAEIEDKLFTDSDDKKVIAICAPHINTRMTSQRSEFTIHMHYTPLDRIKEVSIALKEKIMIPRHLKIKLKDKLRALGVDRSSLFPDLDNIAKTVVEDMLGG